MSSIFQKDLLAALLEVRTQLNNNELIPKNREKAAKLGLYFAHGATEKASGKLVNDQEMANNIGVQLQHATKVAEVCKKIVTAASATADQARNTTSLASTAAVDIQAAADQLTELQANTAATLAIATSENTESSKLYELVNRAFLLAEMAARKAENTSLLSMNTTIEAAQSRAAGSLSQAQVLAQDIDPLLSELNNNFKALQVKIDVDAAALAEALKAENEQTAIYQVALKEEEALATSEKYINRYFNYNLQYADHLDTRAKLFTLSFDGFAQTTTLLEDGQFVERPVISEYRIIITPLDAAPNFDIHRAKATGLSGYHSIKITKQNAKNANYAVEFMTAEYAAAKGYTELMQNFTGNGDQQTFPEVAKDHTGQAVQRGIPYVFFVYTLFDEDFQNETGDTEGLLTLASLPFTLLPSLPAAGKPDLQFFTIKDERKDYSIRNCVKISFEVKRMEFNNVDLSEIMDFRVFLFKQEEKVASKVNHLIENELHKLFVMDEQCRLAEEAYRKATLAYQMAVAQGEKADKIATLKKVMMNDEITFRKRSEAYIQQEQKIERLNQLKLSNFYLDTEILSTIPVAFGIEAKHLSTESTDNDIAALEKSLAEALKILEKLQKGHGNPEKEIKKLEKEIKEIERELDRLKADAGTHKYLAVNEQGDFMDHYGELLLPGQTYTALVYATIKEDAPEAKPLYKANYSVFSDGQVFPLPKV